MENALSISARGFPNGVFLFYLRHEKPHFHFCPEHRLRQFPFLSAQWKLHFQISALHFPKGDFIFLSAQWKTSLSNFSQRLPQWLFFLFLLVGANVPHP